MTPGTTDPQLQLMLQSLLRERFHLTWDREKRDVPVYEFTVAEGGVRMKESPPLSAADSPVSPEVANNEDVESIRRGMTFRWMSSPDGAHIVGQMTIDKLGLRLRSRLAHPMVDKTGLGNKYFDINLFWNFTPSPGMQAMDDHDAGNLFTTMQKNPGLKVRLKTAAEESVVIDHMDHVPTGD
jgi:uncharacterized protein (TIGR03435 family)